MIQILMGQLQCKLIGVLIWQMVENGKGSNIMRRMVLTTIKGPPGIGVAVVSCGTEPTKRQLERKEIYLFFSPYIFGFVLGVVCLLDYVTRNPFFSFNGKKKMGDYNNQSERTTIKKKKERKEWFIVHKRICYMCK